MIRRRTIVWAVAVAGVISAAALVFARGGVIETNLLALLPNVARHPATEEAAAKLGESGARRCIFLIGAGSADAAKASSRRFADVLSAGGAFREVRVEFPSPDPRLVREVYASYRFQLLADED